MNKKNGSLSTVFVAKPTSSKHRRKRITYLIHLSRIFRWLQDSSEIQAVKEGNETFSPSLGRAIASAVEILSVQHFPRSVVSFFVSDDPPVVLHA